MSLFEIFSSFSSNLIEIMGVTLAGVLVIRFAAYRAGRRDHMYFKTFATSINRMLEKEKANQSVTNIDSWLGQLLDRVIDQLPERNLRNTKTQQKGSRFRDGDRKVDSFEDFAEGKRGLIHSVKQMVDSFKSPTTPNFSEMTDRVLRDDKKWSTVLSIIPADTFSRFLDILPGLFIVGGIFGTFIGITGALPMIAAIDLSDLDKAGPILNQFVESVAYSMRTSIAGICYSVTLTLLNTFFPIATIREEVKTHLENCFEAIWFRLHGDEMSGAERKMIQLLDSIDKKLSEESNVKKAA